MQFPSITRKSIDTLQVNLTLKCNQACVHCHVDAGPKRTEQMSDEVIEHIVAYMSESTVNTLDITGGAPELHPRFRYLVQAAHAQGLRVIDRCNLTILFEPGQEDLADFLADHEVEITASLPCYTEDNVDQQRGKGVFEKSIAALQRFNELGYGCGDPKRPLNLVYNPQNPVLPPGQQQLEQDYKQHLLDHFDVHFDQLLVLANMPINRFAKILDHQGCLNEYLGLLKSAHQNSNLENVMCRSLISVDWQGYLYDCDFNQMLNLPIQNQEQPLHIADLLTKNLLNQPIIVNEHCFACTAGQGSSCGGALQSA